jgi:GNAT superfamily N-acetyltransferase
MSEDQAGENHENLKIVLRGIAPEDSNFIYSSLAKSLRDAPLFRNVPGQIFFDGIRSVINSLLNHVVVIACNPEDQSQIFGFAIGTPATPTTPPIVHYVYVKHPFRGFGVGKTLLFSLVRDRRYQYSLFSRGLLRRAAPEDPHDPSMYFEKLNGDYNPFLIGELK